MPSHVDSPMPGPCGPCSSTVRAPQWQIFLLLVLPAACEGFGDGIGSGPGVMVEDSAGVTIVTNDPAAPDSRLPWQFGEQPSLSIGSVDSGDADDLYRVQDATLLADGRIAVANAGSGEIKVFNADGSHEGTWGRQGEGPGEFSRGPSVVARWPGDSIAASDPGGHRVSLFDMNGSHGREIALDPTLLGVIGLLPDGKMFAQGSLLVNRRSTGSPDLIRSDLEWAVLDVDGTRDVSLGEFPAFEDWAVTMPDGSIGEQTHPFGRTTVGTLWGNLLATGVQDSYEIKAFEPDGSLVRIVRRDGDPRKTTQAELDEYFARQVVGRPAEVRTRMLNMVRDMPLVDSYPAFEEIVGDLAGYLWVREYRMFGEGDPVWTVFDPEGRIQGLVETPPGLDIFEIGEDYLLGLVEDELGVEYVQVWALDRGVG